LSAEESELIDRFRAAPVILKGAIMGALYGAEKAHKTGALLPIHPPVSALEDNNEKPES